MMPTMHFAAFLRPIIFAVSASLATAGFAQEPATAPGQQVQENGDLVSLNFNSVDIDAVVRAIGKIAKRNFVVDPRVKGTLNIVTNRPIPRSLTYSILLSALRLQGYAAVESNGIVKILPEADAKMHALPVDKGRGQQHVGDKLITEIFQIKHESAAQLVQVIRPLVTPNNTVSVYPGNNSLVVTDYAENIQKISRIIESIDVPQGDVQVIPVRNASAVDLATTLNKLFSENAGGAAAEPSMRVAILADARSNSLLVRAENRARLQAVRSMAAQLDQAGATSNIRVIFLKNANAAKVAQTLRAAMTGESGGSSQTQTTSNTTSANTNTGTNASNTSMTGGTTPSFSGTNSGSNVVGGGNIFADVANNALVITGPDAVYNNVRAVIEQLDRRPAQVYVEALIAEVSADRAAEFGIQWQGGVPKDSSTTAYGGTNFGSGGQNILNLAQNPLGAASGMNFLVGAGPVTINGTKIFNLNLLARFLESDARANILSTPSLMTVDNEEAKIVVGRNVPFITGTYSNTSGSSGAVSPFNTYERKDVGLTLKIKPQITEGGTIRMQIFQETSAVIDSANSSTSGPSTTKRSVESTVITDDGSIIAIGGLVEDSYAGGVDKVPVLGDIPIIGALFRYDTRKRVKTNLMVFLRPRVLRSADDSATLSQSRYEEILLKQRTADDPRYILKGEGPLPQLDAGFSAAKQ
jgi:general secretion pathway protein D